MRWAKDGHETVVSVLATGAQAWPDRVCLNTREGNYSFAHVDRETNRLAHGLMALGVKPGDTVCTMFDATLEGVLLWFAINKAGAISAPVNTSYKAGFLRHQINDCGAAIIIVQSAYVDRVVEIADELLNIRTLIHQGEPPQNARPWPVVPFESLIAADDGSVGIAPAPSDLSMLIYTSGTTGPSKGCMISHSYACFHARVMISAHGMREGDIAWMPLPIFHLVGTCGMILAGLMVGATSALCTRFSVSNFWPEIETTRANFVCLIGSMLPLIANAPDDAIAQRCFGQIRTVSGGPFSQHLQDTFRTRFGVKVAGTPGYGLTEMSIVTRHRLGDPQPDGTAGRCFEDFDLRIIDDAGDECPTGGVGEVIIRPRRPGIIFDGYWGRPAETLTVMKDLWFHSGDLGRFDENGYFYFVDRKKDYLRKGGENVSSMEVEAVFRTHPDVEDVAIHAVPSALLEDEIKATVVLKAGALINEQALCVWATDRLPAFAVPRYYEMRDTLPRTPTGKVQKAELRKEGVTASTWEREHHRLGPPSIGR